MSRGGDPLADLREAVLLSDCSFNKGWRGCGDCMSCGEEMELDPSAMGDMSPRSAQPGVFTAAMRVLRLPLTLLGVGGATFTSASSSSSSSSFNFLSFLSFLSFPCPFSLSLTVGTAAPAV